MGGIYMGVKFNSIEISESIISQGKEMNINDISPLKLQKLLFLTFQEHKRKNNEPLFDGNFLVWRHGPVNLDVYNEYKSYGSDIISPISVETVNDEKVKSSISNVLEEYGNISAWDLVDITHDEKGVWFKKMKQGESSIEYSDLQ